jgi:hypothetical protein
MLNLRRVVILCGAIVTLGGASSLGAESSAAEAGYCGAGGFTAQGWGSCPDDLYSFCMGYIDSAGCTGNLLNATCQSNGTNFLVQCHTTD